MPCDGTYHVAYWSNQTGTAIYLRELRLYQSATLPLPLHAVVYLSQPGYAAGPMMLLQGAWGLDAPLPSEHVTATWFYAPILMRPGEWLTLLAACAAVPGRPAPMTHEAFIGFSYSITP